MNDTPGSINVDARRVEIVSDSEQAWSAHTPAGHYAVFGPFDSDEDAIGWIDAVAFFQEQAMKAAPPDLEASQ